MGIYFQANIAPGYIQSWDDKFQRIVDIDSQYVVLACSCAHKVAWHNVYFLPMTAIFSLVDFLLCDRSFLSLLSIFHQHLKKRIIQWVETVLFWWHCSVALVSFTTSQVLQVSISSTTFVFWTSWVPFSCTSSDTFPSSQPSLCAPLWSSLPGKCYVLFKEAIYTLHWRGGGEIGLSYGTNPLLVTYFRFQQKSLISSMTM